MKFKNAMGRYLLKGLFFEETTHSDKSGVIYTLKRQDHLGYPSLYRLYMEANDPTEYHFATQHLGGWDHWEELRECYWFSPILDQWRRELEVKLRAEALLAVRLVAKDPDHKSHYQATRFLVGNGWKDDPKRKAGQPSKAEIKQEATRLAEINRTLEDDFERITQPN